MTSQGPAKMPLPAIHYTPIVAFSGWSFSIVVSLSIADHLSLADSEFILGPIIDAAASNNLKIAEPALDCIQKLISHCYLHGEADPAAGPENWVWPL
ncbi:hypothetical protein RJ640_018459 [Escallonia rubra]|uniref:Mon2/Sec7/BIG1-like dimerisation and cyclophilin-binding domain-containing protein n=1 Tax=Escallonia rubra TaxID=112253 RepID=A0AA88R7V1_9ASTE|nr:hypothetical protein RJ640_018459 [Escallonia rubra]